MTLNEFINTHDYVCVYFRSCLDYNYTCFPSGVDGIDTLERLELGALEGDMPTERSWEWNGEGNRTNDSGTTIIAVIAEVDELKWKALRDTYMNETL